MPKSFIRLASTASSRFNARCVPAQFPGPASGLLKRLTHHVYLADHLLVTDILIFKPSVERRAEGIFVHLASAIEPPPSAARAFTWTAGPFATEATAFEALRRKLKGKTLGIAFSVEVTGRRYDVLEPALKAVEKLF